MSNQTSVNTAQPCPRTVEAHSRIVPYGVNAPKTSLPIDVITLVGQAKSDSELYAGPDRKPRRKVYQVQHHEECKQIAKKTTVRVLKHDAAKNAKTMSLCVGILGGLGSLGWIAGPVGGIPGTTLGIAGGTALGGYLIGKRIGKKIDLEIEFSDSYGAWRARAITMKVYPVFKNFLDTDDAFADFMCPIAQDICSVPMLAPDGKTYDQEAINQYIDSCDATSDQIVRSPIRGKDFCRNDLMFNTQYCWDLIQKAEYVYQDVIQYGRDNEIKFGVEAVIKNTQEIMNAIHKQACFKLYYELDDDVRDNKMTSQERDDIIRESTKQWDFRRSALS